MIPQKRCCGKGRIAHFSPPTLQTGAKMVNCYVNFVELLQIKAAIDDAVTHMIHAASLDGMSGHHRVARRFRLLREGEPARVFDLADSERAVRVGTRKHDADCTFPIRGRK